MDGSTVYPVAKLIQMVPSATAIPELVVGGQLFHISHLTLTRELTAYPKIPLNVSLNSHRGGNLKLSVVLH